MKKLTSNFNKELTQCTQRYEQLLGAMEKKYQTEKESRDRELFDQAKALENLLKIQDQLQDQLERAKLQRERTNSQRSRHSRQSSDSHIEPLKLELERKQTLVETL